MNVFNDLIYLEKCSKSDKENPFCMEMNGMMGKVELSRLDLKNSFFFYFRFYFYFYFSIPLCIDSKNTSYIVQIAHSKCKKK